jgi:hypothetical protein
LVGPEKDATMKLEQATSLIHKGRRKWAYSENNTINKFPRESLFSVGVC